MELCPCEEWGPTGYACLDEYNNCKLRMKQGKEQKLDKTRGAYIAAYREGFMNGLDAKDKFKYCILGYEIGQLIDIIAKHEEQKMKTVNMTKAKAVKILTDRDVPRDISGNYLILDVLEALGVIEFEPEPEPNPIQLALCTVMIETEVRQGPDYGKITPGYPSMYGAGCLIDGLRMKGYEITKIKD